MTKGQFKKKLGEVTGKPEPRTTPKGIGMESKEFAKQITMSIFLLHLGRDVIIVIVVIILLLIAGKTRRSQRLYISLM